VGKGRLWRLGAAGAAGAGAAAAGRCRLTVSTPMLKAPMVSAFEATYDKPLSISAFSYQLEPLHSGGRGPEGSVSGHGRALQVDPIKPTLKPPGAEHLKLKCGVPPSNFAFKFKLRRYSMVYPTEDYRVYAYVTNTRARFLLLYDDRTVRNASYTHWLRPGAYTRPRFGST